MLYESSPGQATLLANTRPRLAIWYSAGKLIIMSRVNTCLVDWQLTRYIVAFAPEGFFFSKIASDWIPHQTQTQSKYWQSQSLASNNIVHS